MASIFTIQGASDGKRRKRRKRRSSGLACTLGEHKRVYNPRTKRHTTLECVGKAASRTGWKFVKGR